MIWQTTMYFETFLSFYENKSSHSVMISKMKVLNNEDLQYVCPLLVAKNLEKYLQSRYFYVKLRVSITLQVFSNNFEYNSEEAIKRYSTEIAPLHFFSGWISGRNF